MIKDFIKRIGPWNVIMILVVLITIVISETVFLMGHKLSGIFIGLWAPTILGFMNYFKSKD
ncbi:hypothetical protein E7Z59_11870 [Robertkochia marina]|uniref:Uncharacterized protein n=1 Tax=Robertkochia marina TaxID=1227945 RepID=A0A4S3LY62_9FLAO|nr:hypothetical protein [Robertkochia marina]THD66492.1 hypothetical protein E7Z59_11870 [Robertkochia marina]TRZ45668.1 hypothetical protein D3A96_06765 [Robertkochia marina]